MKSYERHIEGDRVFFCSMTEEERNEYVADLHAKEAGKPKKATKCYQWENIYGDGGFRHRIGRQGGYTVDHLGNTSNGLAVPYYDGELF